MNSKRKESESSQQGYDKAKQEFRFALSDIAKNGGISHGDPFPSFLAAAFGALLQACNLVKYGREDEKLEASIVAEQRGWADYVGLPAFGQSAQTLVRRNFGLVLSSCQLYENSAASLRVGQHRLGDPENGRVRHSVHLCRGGAWDFACR